MYIYINTYIYTHRVNPRLLIFTYITYIYLCVCMHTYMYIYTHRVNPRLTSILCAPLCYFLF